MVAGQDHQSKKDLLNTGRASLRDRLLELVQADTPRVCRVQQFFGVRSTTKRGPIIFQILFTFGAALGNELFYILFLPFLFWCADRSLGRSVILLWCILYYFGQLAKDILKLPRPPSPPVIALETHYEAEYGLPSTHSMAAISIPFYMLAVFEPFQSYEYFPIALTIAILWFLCMSFSRLYMGVHCTLDIVAGWLFGMIIVIPVYLLLDNVDYVVMFHNHSPVITFAFAMFLVLLYPLLARPVKWTNTYGDTALILATTTGVFWGSFANSTAAIDTIYPFFSHLPKFTALPSVSILFSIIRCIVGYAILILTRSVVKSIGMKLMVLILPESSIPPKNRYSVEIPTKFLTYSGVGFNAVYTVPYIFSLMKI